jgi:hypothetical protein
MHFTFHIRNQKKNHFWILKKNSLSMHVLKERYVKKCVKDIYGSELYTFSSFILLKTQYIFKNNYKIGLL